MLKKQLKKWNKFFVSFFVLFANLIFYTTYLFFFINAFNLFIFMLFKMFFLVLILSFTFYHLLNTFSAKPNKFLISSFVPSSKMAIPSK